MAAQHADHINLADVQPRPHRRRRERKLLSMEEVERQFPLCKYGDWVERRKNEGAAVPSGGVDAETAKSLHNAEGVIAPVSPPVSPGLKEVEGKREAGKTDETTTTVDEVVAPPAAPAAPAPAVVASPIPNESRNHSHTILPAPYPGTPSNEKPSDPSILATLAQVDTRQTHDPKSPHPHDTDSEPDSDHEALHPVDTSDHPGDTCAICIDTLLASDDIRGLTCNHAFHASCIDPWLTSRRACCPLCKRDFWVPKVRTPAEEAAEEERRNNRRLRREALRAERLAGGPGVGGVWAVRGTRVYIPGRLMGGGVMFREESQYQNSRHARTARERQRAWDEHVANRQRERDLRRAERERADGAGSTRTLAQRFNGLFGRSANAPAAPTPSQVEAGTAPQVTAPAPAAVPGNALQSRF